MVNLLPHRDNLLHFYDYHSYQDGVQIWKNELKDNKDFILNGSSYDTENDAIYLPQTTGYGYVATELGNAATMYAVVKFLKVKNFSGSTWGITVCSNSSSNRLYYGQDASNYNYIW